MAEAAAAAQDDLAPDVPQDVAEDGGVEERARRMGWKPAGEFDDRRQYLTAEEFIKRGEEELPILRARNRKLDHDYTKTLTKIAELEQTFQDFRTFMTRAEERAYQKARRELEERREAAVQVADTATYKATQTQIEELDKEARELVGNRDTSPRSAAQTPNQAAQPQQMLVDPVADQWVRDNPWFLSDSQLNRAAKALDSEILASSPGLSPAERLATVKQEVIRMYPDKFKNPLREAPAAVSTPGAQGNTRARRDGKTYENLPPEAKKACDKFVKQIKGFTREDYLKDYDWS